MANTRFAVLKKKLAKQPDVTDPAALAAADRKQYGTGHFEATAKKKHKKHKHQPSAPLDSEDLAHIRKES